MKSIYGHRSLSTILWILGAVAWAFLSTPALLAAQQGHARVTKTYPCLARVRSREEQRLSGGASQFRTRAWHRYVSPTAA